MPQRMWQAAVEAPADRRGGGEHHRQAEGRVESAVHRPVTTAERAILEQAFNPECFRVGAVAGEAHQADYGPERAFEFGLQRVLDGTR